MNTFSKLSPSVKIALAILVFFVINASMALVIDKLPAFAAYVVGFSLGSASVFFGLTSIQRRTFSESDLQLAAGLAIGKQLAATPIPVKGLSAEVLQSIYTAKAHFQSETLVQPKSESKSEDSLVFPDLRLAA